MDERVIVRVDFNEFTQLWQVHGTKTTYWLEEYMARKRAGEVQELLDEKWRKAQQARLAPTSRPIAADSLDAALNPQVVGLDGAHHDAIVYRAKFDTAVRFCRTVGLTAQEVREALDAALATGGAYLVTKD